jgi:hypothetical protein
MDGDKPTDAELGPGECRSQLPKTITSQNGNHIPLVRSNSITGKQVSSWILVTLRQSAWAPLSVFGFYLFGLAFHLYILYPNLDIPTHLLGGIAITYFYRVAIRNSQEFLGGIPFAVQVLFAFTLTGTTIILWEFLETIVDFLFNAHNVLGVFDTVKDMFVGLLGALLLTLFYRRR